jgi:hypothetical protein
MPQVIYVYKKKIALPGKVVTTQWVASDPTKPYVGQKQQVTVLNAINPENCQKPDGFPDHPSLAAHLA